MSTTQTISFLSAYYQHLVNILGVLRNRGSLGYIIGCVSVLPLTTDVWAGEWRVGHRKAFFESLLRPRCLESKCRGKWWHPAS